MTDTPAPNVYPAPAPAAGGSAGLASLVLGLLLVVGGLVLQVVSVSLPLLLNSLGLDYAAVGVMFGVTGVITVVVAIVTVVLGIGLQAGRPRGRLAAAAGLALGASHLLSALVGVATPLILSAVA